MIKFELVDLNDECKIIEYLSENKKTFKYSENEKFITAVFYQIALDKKTIGYFGINVANGDLCIHSFYIKPEFRGKGYAKKVIDELVKKYKQKYSVIFGFVEEDNYIAIKLYQHYNFLAKDRMNILKINNFDASKSMLYKDDTSYEVIFYLKK